MSCHGYQLRDRYQLRSSISKLYDAHDMRVLWDSGNQTGLCQLKNKGNEVSFDSLWLGPELIVRLVIYSQVCNNLKPNYVRCKTLLILFIWKVIGISGTSYAFEALSMFPSADECFFKTLVRFQGEISDTYLICKELRKNLGLNENSIPPLIRIASNCMCIFGCV